MTALLHSVRPSGSTLVPVINLRIVTHQATFDQLGTGGSVFSHACASAWHLSKLPLHSLLRSVTLTVSGQLLTTSNHPQVGFIMRRITKGGVTIKMWDLGGQVRAVLQFRFVLFEGLFEWWPLRVNKNGWIETMPVDFYVFFCFDSCGLKKGR